MNQHLIIAVVGLIGSGKTEATARFVARGFARVGFNDPVYEELERRGLERNEKNERMVREGLRKEDGMGVMAIRSLPRVEAAFAQGQKVVVESLYSWEEYKIMRERFGDRFRVVAIFGPPEKRYDRLAIRPVRPLDREAAKTRDYSQIENLNQAGPIAMADWLIPNIADDKEKFFYLVDKLIDGIL